MLSKWAPNEVVDVSPSSVLFNITTHYPSKISMPQYCEIIRFPGITLGLQTPTALGQLNDLSAYPSQ